MNEQINPHQEAAEQATRIIDAMEKVRDEAKDGYELWLPSGVSLRLPKNFDPEELRTVIEKLSMATRPLPSAEVNALAALFTNRGFLPAAPKVICIQPTLAEQYPMPGSARSPEPTAFIAASSPEPTPFIAACSSEPTASIAIISAESMPYSAAISAEPTRTLGIIRDLLLSQGYQPKGGLFTDIDQELGRIAKQLGFERSGEPNNENAKEAIECLAEAAGFVKSSPPDRQTPNGAIR